MTELPDPAAPQPGSPRPASPLRPLAWGFLALFPLPIVVLFFTPAEQVLARGLECGMAVVLLVAAGLLFAADWRATRRGS